MVVVVFLIEEVGSLGPTWVPASQADSPGVVPFTTLPGHCCIPPLDWPVRDCPYRIRSITLLVREEVLKRRLTRLGFTIPLRVQHCMRGEGDAQQLSMWIVDGDMRNDEQHCSRTNN